MRIRDSVVVVTGASSGIGAATARELAYRGAHVVIAARRLDRLHQLADNTGAIPVQTDVADPAALQRLVQHTVARFNRIDALVNNAGIGSRRDIQRETAESIQHLFAVNVVAPVLLSREALPHMPRGGVIVNVGSTAAEGPGINLYAVTKADVKSFTHALRIQVAARGIKVVLVEPGFVRTEMTADRRVPLPVPGPEVVARAIADAIERPRATVIVPAWYLPLVLAARVAPRPLVEAALKLSRSKSR